MKLMRFIGTAGMAASLTLVSASVASASDVVLETTGPDSNQEVVINNSMNVSSTNINVVEVNNANVQHATTGDVTAEKNTSVDGALSSGDATNTAKTSTVIAVNNPSVGGIGENNVPAGGNGSNVGGSHTGQPAGGQGNVLGASTGGLGGGAATLPQVGPSLPVDVSAIRAAWQPQVDAPTTSVVKQAQGVTAIMLVTAALLSLLGAIGTAVYARRKEGKV